MLKAFNFPTSKQKMLNKHPSRKNAVKKSKESEEFDWLSHCILLLETQLVLSYSYAPTLVPCLGCGNKMAFSLYIKKHPLIFVYYFCNHAGSFLRLNSMHVICNGTHLKIMYLQNIRANIATGKI